MNWGGGTMNCKFCGNQMYINYDNPNIHYCGAISDVCIYCASKERVKVGVHIQLENGEYVEITEENISDYKPSKIKEKEEKEK